MTHFLLNNISYPIHYILYYLWQSKFLPIPVPLPMFLFVCFMVFNATFNNISVISWQSVLLVEETGVHGENH